MSTSKSKDTDKSNEISKSTIYCETDGTDTSYNEDTSSESSSSSLVEDFDTTITNRGKDANATIDSIKDFEQQNRTTLMLVEESLNSINNESKMECNVEEMKTSHLSNNNKMGSTVDKHPLQSNALSTRNVSSSGFKELTKQESIKNKSNEVCEGKNYVYKTATKSSLNTETTKSPLMSKQNESNIVVHKKKPFLKISRPQTNHFFMRRD